MSEVFDCPSCGAPLKPDGPAATVTCAFCDESVVVPMNLRTGQHRSAATSTPTFGQIPAIYVPSPATYTVPQARRSGVGCGLLVTLLIVVFSVGLPLYITNSVFNTVNHALGQQSDNQGATVSTPKPTATPTPALAEAVFTLDGATGGPSAFKDSQAVTVDQAGNLYLTDTEPGRILKFDSQGTFVAAWPVGDKYPTKLVAGPGGVLYNVSVNVVRVYNANSGQLQDSLSWKDDDFGFFGFNQIVVLPDGNLLATLTDTDNLVKIDPQGNEVRRYAHPLKGHTTNNEPNLVPATDAQGNIYLLEEGAARVYKLAANGTFLNTVGNGDKGHGALDNPHSLAIDPAGRIYVGDSEGIEVFDVGGGYLGLIATPSYVYDLIAFGDGEVLATMRGKVVKYRLNASVLAAIQKRQGTRPTPTPVPTSTPLPGVGSTLTMSGWVISLGSVTSRPTLELPKQNTTLQPDYRYVLVAIDARNQQTRAHSLAADFDWSIRDDNDRVYDPVPTDRFPILNTFIRQEQRDPLGQAVAPQALAHPLLVFDVPAGAPGLQLVIRSLADHQEYDFALGRP